MFEILSEKFSDLFRQLNNKGRLTESDVDEALRDVRMALLEADVNFKVARNLITRIRERVLEGDVLKSLTPGQQVVKVTNEAMIEILGSGTKQLESSSDRPSVILMVGLNGSGKTTTAAKLARNLKQIGQLSVLIAADLQRPAAVKQLEILGRQIDVDVYHPGASNQTVKVIKDGIKYASKINADWAIVDTAGRFQIDDELMSELEEIKSSASPTETLLVVDSMTGQDAVRAATEFHERVGLTGLVLTKLDGDARGGAAISITEVTGVPVKFIGTGERIESLEQFHPERMASRILGMGDMLTLIEKAQSTFDNNQLIEMEKKIRGATFDLNDFLAQIQQLKNMGPLSQIMEMIPGFSGVHNRISTDELDEDRTMKIEALIYSMTSEERRRPEIIGGSRRRRIANGSGTKPQDVNQLLNQFRQMQKLMKQMTSGKARRKLSNVSTKGGGPFNFPDHL